MNDGDLDVVLRHHGGLPLADVAEASLEQTGEVSVRRMQDARPATRRDVTADAA